MGYRDLNTHVKLPNDAHETWYAVFRVGWDHEPEIVGYVDTNPVAVVNAAERLILRHSPWLAVSPPRYDEAPECFGCGVLAQAVGNGQLLFEHQPDCAAWDLAAALADVPAPDDPS